MNIKFKRIVTSAGVITSLLFGITACSTPKLSDSLYRQSEVGVAKRIKRCRVLAVREVEIRDGSSNDLGALAGGIVGGTLGSGVGGGSGKILATEVGAIAGAVIGKKATDRLSGHKGLEYSVITRNGDEYTLTQAFLKGDRVVKIGETCRLQIASDGRNRVLPAEGLVSEIMAPKRTKIIQ